MSADIYDRYIEVCHRSNEQADEIRRLTAERDALRGEVERLRGPEVVTMSRLQYEADGDQAAHYVAEQTAEAIATWLEQQHDGNRSYELHEKSLAADIRAGSWRKEPK